MKRKFIIAFVLIMTSLYSACFAKGAPQFEHLFSTDYADFYYDSNNTHWNRYKESLDTVIRVRFDDGETHTSLNTVKNNGKYVCCQWDIIDSNGNRRYIDNTSNPQYEEVIEKDMIKLWTTIWNRML